MSSFDYERRVWNDEVDAEAARLVRQGVAPIDAAAQASRNVSNRRRIATGGSPYDAGRGGFIDIRRSFK